MRSLFYLAAFTAVISFTGCSCGSGKIGKLGRHEDKVASSVAAQAYDIGGDCGCDAQETTASMGDCGCSTPASGNDCTSCGDSASYATPCAQTAPARSAQRGLMPNKGLGLFLKSKGQHCAKAALPKPTSMARPTKSISCTPAAAAVYSGNVATAQCESCVTEPAYETCMPTAAQQPVESVKDKGARRISTGIFSDIRAAFGGRKASDAPSSSIPQSEAFACDDGQYGEVPNEAPCGCSETEANAQPCGDAECGCSETDANAQPCGDAECGCLANRAGRPKAHRTGGCGIKGCGLGGRPCHSCAMRQRSMGPVNHPYGGAIPHTYPAPSQQGMAPAYAYPYYTTRGPRDFLRDNPPSIGY